MTIFLKYVANSLTQLGMSTKNNSPTKYTEWTGLEVRCLDNDNIPPPLTPVVWGHKWLTYPITLFKGSDLLEISVQKRFYLKFKLLSLLISFASPNFNYSISFWYKCTGIQLPWQFFVISTDFLQVTNFLLKIMWWAHLCQTKHWTQWDSNLQRCV